MKSTRLVLKMGRALHPVRQRLGDFEDWLIDAMGADHAEFQVIDVPGGQPLPQPQLVSSVVITGSEAMVTQRAPWMSTAQAWLQQLIDLGIPVLGICFGHQLLADMLGGTVADDPNGREIGAATVRLTRQGMNHWLFKGLPSNLPVHEAHSQSVLRPPIRGSVLATGRAGVCQAFAYRNAVGLQFHPEFTPAIMHAYLDALEQTLVSEGLDTRALHEQIVPNTTSRQVLRRFYEFVPQGVDSTEYAQ